MQLPEELRQRLIMEYRFAAEQMQETDDPYESLYYLSVFFGEASRVLNWHWDSELALLHVVIMAAQQGTSNALAKMTTGERVVKITPAFINAITQAAVNLAEWMDHNGTSEQFLTIMARFAELGYATSGNGYYLMTRGYIKVEG